MIRNVANLPLHFLQGLPSKLHLVGPQETANRREGPHLKIEIRSKTLHRVDTIYAITPFLTAAKQLIKRLCNSSVVSLSGCLNRSLRLRFSSFGWRRTVFVNLKKSWREVILLRRFASSFKLWDRIAIFSKYRFRHILSLVQKDRFLQQLDIYSFLSLRKISQRNIRAYKRCNIPGDVIYSIGNTLYSSYKNEFQHILHLSHNTEFFSFCSYIVESFCGTHCSVVIQICIISKRNELRSVLHLAKRI